MSSDWVNLFYRSTNGAVVTRRRHPDGSWSPERTLGGTANSDITAAFIPGVHLKVLQLFYVGADGAVVTRDRHPDGSWSPEQTLGGSANSNITAIVIPGTEVLQLFYAGTDNSVHSRWRHHDGSWSAEQNLGGVVRFGDITPIVLPGTDIVQLFYVADTAVLTRWRNPDGSWSAEQDLGVFIEQPFTAVGSYLVTACVVPGSEIVQLFYRSGDDHVHSIWRNANGSWSPVGSTGSDQNLGGGAVGSTLSGITAITVPGTEILQLFYQGSHDGAVHSRWRDPDGSWLPANSDQDLGGDVTGFHPDIAAIVLPGTQILQLFYVGTDNAVHSRWRNPDGSWSPTGPDQNLGGVAMSGITAVAVPEPR
jgi:hypothetical protein